MVIEASSALGVATVALRLLPFERAIRLGSAKLGGRGAPSSGVTLNAVRWAVGAAASHLPWTTVCIQQGLAAQWMLRRRGVDARLYYGINTDDQGELKAHVWVEALGEVITGGDFSGEYPGVATFP
jgi:hypothetical protein